jgi:hypothetical protein
MNNINCASLLLLGSIAGEEGSTGHRHVRIWKVAILLAVSWIANTSAMGQGNDQLVGIWHSDDGFRTVDLLFRSEGRYQLDTQSTDPAIDLSSTERGHYLIEGQALTLTPYDYLVRPEPRSYQFERSGDSLTLASAEFGQTESFQFRPGSKADVLARENVVPQLVRVWHRHIPFLGEAECTFRPGGYYVVKQAFDDPQFATTYIRGRYDEAGNQLTLKPYSEAQEIHEMDFFGNELTLIKTDNFSSQSVTFEAIPGSDTDVPIKAAQAEAVLASTNWQVGIWDIGNASQVTTLTLRPDGRHTAEEGTGMSEQIVRGRYTLDSRSIHLMPFIGQDIYSHSGDEFGNAERIRQLDYYDGELQFIDLDAIIQSVTTAHKRAGSEALVTDKVNQAQSEQARDGWCVGTWQVNDTAGWMEFTFRPDQRYIIKAGTAGAPKEVDRGRYGLGADKLTLVPYPNLGRPRGFELDYYDGALLLIGDPNRMVVARKIPGSEGTVTKSTIDPDALKGARGPLVGLWTMQLNGYYAELLFRPDGQFRLTRCYQGKQSKEYGLWSADVTTGSLVLDSRLVALVTAGLDFYGGTMTLFSTNQGFPATYVLDQGSTDAALQASLAADAQEAELDALWLKRVLIGPSNTDVGELPLGEIDLHPEHVFEGATAFTQQRHYQRQIPSFVNFGPDSVPVVNTQEWYFLRNGRVLIKFTQYVAGAGYPFVVPTEVKVWGAYHIDPSPAVQDIFHFYADNSLHIETDASEQLELTLENGRRYLFWGKDRAELDEWVAEEPATPCNPPANFDPSLMNTGVSLQTTIAPDDLTEAIQFSLARSITGNLTLQGTSLGPATLVIEKAMSLTAPVDWKPVQTNAVPIGPFNFTIPSSTNGQAYYRLRHA